MYSPPEGEAEPTSRFVLIISQDKHDGITNYDSGIVGAFMKTVKTRPITSSSTFSCERCYSATEIPGTRCRRCNDGRKWCFDRELQKLVTVLIVAPTLCGPNHYLAVIIPNDKDGVRYGS